MLACLMVAFVTVDAGAAPVSPAFYGVNSGSKLVRDPVDRPATFAAMRAGGLAFVRADASWDSIEPTAPVAGRHTYEWSMYDLFVADLARQGLRWYPMLGYGTPWATSIAGDLFAAPSDDDAFGAFVAAFAQRYGSGGTFWAQHPELPALPTTIYGIWNEPSNDTFWRGAAATPARYLRLYLTARAAIKAVDARATVATAGILDSAFADGQTYLRAMLASAPAARDQIDALDWHPYVGDLEQIGASIRRARSTLDEFGLRGVPIEVSEVGWHNALPTALRAEWLRGLAATLPFAGLNVTRLIPYVWSDDPPWELTNPDGSIGVLGDAYFAGIRDARSPEPLALPPITHTQLTTGSKPCTRRQSRAKRNRSAKKCVRTIRRRAGRAKATVAK